MRCFHSKRSTKSTQGFTLIELVTVIVLLGILSVSIGGFIKLSSQIYVDVSSRDELIASARFSVERMNREIRNALPNSVRTINNTGNTIQCLEFIPTITSAVYLDIPVFPEPVSDKITLVRFNDALIDFSMRVAVYPLTANELYDGSSNRIASLKNPQTPIKPLLPVEKIGEWTYTLTSTMQFAGDSPTERLFFIGTPISYCAQNGKLTRHTQYGYSDNIPNNFTSTNAVLMAEHVVLTSTADFPFRVIDATLLRNSVVSILLKFSQNNEDIVFNNEVQVPNVP